VQYKQRSLFWVEEFGSHHFAIFLYHTGILEGEYSIYCTEELIVGRGVWESPLGNRLAFTIQGFWRVGTVYTVQRS
jgi:hypothetical protein